MRVGIEEDPLGREGVLGGFCCLVDIFEARPQN
jgi:hypothetical protein